MSPLLSRIIPFTIYFYDSNDDTHTQGQTLTPVSILYKSTAGRYRPVRVADGPITARYRFIKNASWDMRTYTHKKMKTAYISVTMLGINDTLYFHLLQDSTSVLVTCIQVPGDMHYENTPIQIYRKFHLQKLKIFR